jgi:hypothetical protein
VFGWVLGLGFEAREALQPSSVLHFQTLTLLHRLCHVWCGLLRFVQVKLETFAWVELWVRGGELWGWRIAEMVIVTSLGVVEMVTVEVVIVT